MCYVFDTGTQKDCKHETENPRPTNSDSERIWEFDEWRGFIYKLQADPLAKFARPVASDLRDRRHSLTRMTLQIAGDSLTF